MGCVQKSDMGMTKKWGKSAKIWGTFKHQYLNVETSCSKASKARSNYYTWTKGSLQKKKNCPEWDICLFTFNPLHPLPWIGQRKMGHNDLVIYPLPPSSKWDMKNIQDLYVHNQYEACFHLMTPLFKENMKKCHKIGFWQANFWKISMIRHEKLPPSLIFMSHFWWCK